MAIARYPDPRAKPPEFIAPIWKAQIAERIHALMIKKYSRLEWTWVGEIREKGDRVRFVRLGRRTMTMIADRDVLTDHWFKDRDLEYSMDNVMEDIADGIVTGLKNIPLGPAMFCGAVTEIGLERENYTHSVRMRTLFVYGYKSLDPIRVATEIIGECHRRGMSVSEISKELGKEFDHGILWERAMEAFR